MFEDFSTTVRRLYHEAMRHYMSEVAYRRIVRGARAFKAPPGSINDDDMKYYVEGLIAYANCNPWCHTSYHCGMIEGLSIPAFLYAHPEIKRYSSQHQRLITNMTRALDGRSWRSQFDNTNVKSGYYHISNVRGGVKFQGHEYSSATHLAKHLLTDEKFLNSELVAERNHTRTRDLVYFADIVCDSIFAAVWLDHLQRKYFLENL